MSKASDWLRGKRDTLINSKNPFQLAVTAYTLAKASNSYSDANGETAIQLLETLETIASQGLTKLLPA